MRRVLKVALWLLAIGVLLSALVGGFAALSVWRQTTITSSTAEAADKEFIRIRERFAGRPPLVEIADPGPVMMDVRVHHPAESAPRRKLDYFHVLAWDGKGARLIRTRAPIWWMRFSVGDLADRLGMPKNSFSVSVADVERYGPGIIVDTAPPGGGQLLVWVE